MKTLAGLRPWISRSIVIAAFIAALSLLTFGETREVEAIAPFATTTTARYCNALPATFNSSDPVLAGNPACTDPAPILASTAYPLTTELTVPAGNSMPSGPYFTLLNSGTTAADLAIPNGTKVGGVLNSVYVEVGGTACTTSYVAGTVLYDSATSGSTVAPAAEGTPNRFGGLVTDVGSDFQADASSLFVTQNLTIYETLFDPDATPGGVNGPLPPIQPRARYSGAILTAGEWRLTSVFVFNAGALQAFSDDATNSPSPLGRLSRTPGDSLVLATVIGDPTASVVDPSPVGSTCGPATLTTMLLGTAPGPITRYTTPTSGTRTIGQYGQGHRDADGDTIDNTLDTCPLAVNTGSDVDADGLDSACDPTPGVDTGGGDHDGDGLSNRFDNCPLAPNSGALQKESEANTGYLTAAPDGGPLKDGIGDACDPGPTTATGGFVEDYNFVPKCIGTGTNADGDGYCATQDLNDSNSGVGGFSLNRGSDQDGIGTGRDNFGSNTEAYVGTDPFRACAGTPAMDDEAVDASPADFDDDGAIDVGDALRIRAVLNTTVPSTSARYDIFPDKLVNLSDVLQSSLQWSNTGCGVGSTPVPTDGPVSLLLDANVSGNDARLTGGANIQTCRSTTTSSSIDVDIVVPSPGIGGFDGLAAAELTLDYNPAVVRVTSVSNSYLLAAAGTSAHTGFSDILPDSDGDFRVGMLDLGLPVSPEPAGPDEVGPGVLMRITLQALAPGTSALSITSPVLYSSDQGAMILNLNGAEVRVDQACNPVVNSPADDPDFALDGICETGAGNGICTLRAAIQEANSIVGANTITFAIGFGPQTMTPLSALPALTGLTTIDGWTQPGYSGTPVITLDGTSAGANPGLTLSGSGGNVVKALEIKNFGAGGVALNSSGNVLNTGNAIHNNTGPGVGVISGTANSIRGNSIYANSGLGIDLANDGLTADDPDDADSGPNNKQNHGVIASALRSGGNTIMTGYGAGALASTAYTIDLYANSACDGSGYGEGQTLQTFFPVTSDASGEVRASGIVALPLTPGTILAHTATDPAGNTSEFGRCATVLLDSDGDGIEDTVDTIPGTFSDAFSDVGLGGTTTGSIVSRAGLTVSVTPTTGCALLTVPQPRCLVIGSPGPIPPPAAATINRCGFPLPLSLTQNDLVLVGCASALTAVLSGPVETTYGTIPVSMPTGTDVEVTDLGGGLYDMDTSGGSSGNVTAGGYVIPPGSSVTVQDPDGDALVNQVDNCPTFATVWVVPTGDVDCDGFPDTVTTAGRGRENFIGTDAMDRCPDTTTPNDEQGPGVGEPLSPWPPDVNDSRTVSLADISLMSGAYNKTFPAAGYDPRMDMNANNNVSLSDVSLMSPFYNKTCTP